MAAAGAARERGGVAPSPPSGYAPGGAADERCLSKRAFGDPTTENMIMAKGQDRGKKGKKNKPKLTPKEKKERKRKKKESP
jgi:hypothetical protein